MKNKDVNVLITSAGRRVELVKAWKDSLKKFGKNSKVIACDMNPRFSPACQYADESFEICHSEHSDYSYYLLNECLNRNINFVIPTIDNELIPLSNSRLIFKEKGINLIISDIELINKCRNKIKTYDLFKNLKIKTPVLLNKSDLQYPCFMKPINGSSSKGTKLIKNESEITIEEIKNKNNIFQEYIGTEWKEFSADLYYSKESKLVKCIPRERIETRGGEISKGITRKDKIYEFLVAKLKNFKGARGVLTIQIFANYKEEKYLGIEINPRFGGGYPMSHAVGAKFTDMLLEEYLLNKNMSFSHEWEQNALMLRYDNMCIIRD